MLTARVHGFSLMELLIGVFLTTLLMTGIVQLLTGSVAAYRLQLDQSQLEESNRFARDVLGRHIAQAGYQPEPWENLSAFPALTPESLNGDSLRGDQLGLQRWSNQNCYGNDNPVVDSAGRPAFHLLRLRFRVNPSKNLALTCRYGSEASALVTQINNHGLVEDVEAMHVLYAEDNDADHIGDSWVTAQAWHQETNVKAVKVALLLSSRQVYGQPVSTEITLLDETLSAPADGHLRQVRSFTVAIRGRLK